MRTEVGQVKYKGYTANIKYSKEDEVYYAAEWIEGCLITCQSKQLEEMQSEFEASVDEYYDWVNEEQEYDEFDDEFDRENEESDDEYGLDEWSVQK